MMAEWRRELDWRHVVGSVIIGILLFLVIGFAAGGHSPPGPPPSIDFSETPAEVASDSLKRLETADFTVVSKVVSENLSTGERTKEIDQRETARISHSTGRYHVRSILEHTESGNVTNVVFRNPYSIWQGLNRTDLREWRVPLGSELDKRWLGRIADGIDSESVGSRLEKFSWEAVSNTPSTLTIRTSDPRAVSVFSNAPEENASVRLEISKSPTPHLRRVATTHYYRGKRWDTTYTVAGIGNTTVRRPDSIPPKTVQEIKNRIAIGWKRLWPL